MDSIGNIFRKAFEGHAIEPNNAVWDNIEKRLNSNPTSTNFSFIKNKMAYFASSVLLISIITFIFFKVTNNLNTNSASNSNSGHNKRAGKNKAI